jgi:hypothetical protein
MKMMRCPKRVIKIEEKKSIDGASSRIELIENDVSFHLLNSFLFSSLEYQSA